MRKHNQAKKIFTANWYALDFLEIDMKPASSPFIYSKMQKPVPIWSDTTDLDAFLEISNTLLILINGLLMWNGYEFLHVLDENERQFNKNTF